MEIKISRKNYRQLIQCVYLGELMINGYREDKDIIKEYSEFTKKIYKQVIKELPESALRIELIDAVLNKTEEMLLCDLSDRILDTVVKYYTDYNKSAFCEILAEKIANTNYPVTEEIGFGTLDNVLARNLYYKILLSADSDFVTINAPRIDDQLSKAKAKFKEQTRPTIY